ncbi:MAG: cyclic nucleotide-binding domain-containing protein [Treponema sp.]|jgi:CRP-like cAMP-binding protein|nr:cyclic nucleotide-binding domain-containing protein [Treponema sp.]
MVNSKTLQKYSIFGGLLEEQIESILPLMGQESYGADTEIITEGKPNDKIYFLMEGEAAVIKGGAVIFRVVEGEIFGEMEVLDIMPSAATVKTLSPVTVMSISNKNLREIYRMDIKIFSLIVMNLARDISRRLRRMDEKFTVNQRNVT